MDYDCLWRVRAVWEPERDPAFVKFVANDARAVRPIFYVVRGAVVSRM